MSGSFEKIDYRIRPAKHAERHMLLDIFRRLRFAPIEQYRYVGFGSVAFVDFKMVHRSLGIKHLTSIEDVKTDADRNRFKYNKPFRNIILRFGHSSSILPTIDFSHKSIVWLDYDGALSRSIANDIASIARRSPSGTFIAATFTTLFPKDSVNASAELGRLKDDFPEYLGDDAKPITFQNGRLHAQFGRRVLGDLLDKAISDADAGETDPHKRRAAFQVCFFRYKDGAWMATVGWVIVSEADLDVFQSCHLDNLPFAATGAEPFKIQVPLVTPLEVREMERRLPNLAAASMLDWIPEAERSAFASMHRYLPNFSVTESY